jgi:hypothetical protein
MLVDLIWSGKVEEVCYPIALLPEELLEARLTAGNLKIRKENDRDDVHNDWGLLSYEEI